MAFRSLICARNRIPSLLRHSSASLSSARSSTVFPRRLVAFRLFSTDYQSRDDGEAENMPPPDRFGKKDSREAHQGLNVKPEVLLPGCDFKHWLIFMEPPSEYVSREDIIKSYIDTLAVIVGRWSQWFILLFPFRSFSTSIPGIKRIIRIVFFFDILGISCVLSTFKSH